MKKKQNSFINVLNIDDDIKKISHVTSGDIKLVKKENVKKKPQEQMTQSGGATIKNSFSNQKHPKNLLRYKELVRLFRDQNFSEDIHKILQNPVEVIVLATMSAGKSTLLNALIGKELLPASNEACTARICRIEDHDWEKNFLVRVASSNGCTDWAPATPGILRELNCSDKPGLIELRGNVQSVQNLGAHLILYDTPGPNNSRDKEHKAITSQILKTGNYGLVLYLLNSTQLGVTDDSDLLRQLQEVSANPERHKEVVFVLNKVDKLDEERSESLNRVVADVEAYLQKHGFPHPVIVPTCAQGAMIARHLKATIPLTRREKGDLSGMIEQFRTDPLKLTRAARLPKNIQSRVQNLLTGKIDSPIMNVPNVDDATHKLGLESIDSVELEQFIASTGVKTLELILEDILLRQGLPSTMQMLQESFCRHGALQLAKWIK